MLFPYFVDNWIVLLGVGLVLTILPFVLRSFPAAFQVKAHLENPMYVVTEYPLRGGFALMKRRGWRVALTVATLGLALVAGLVALNWATVSDHAEAWWFQATRDTAQFHPGRPEDALHLRGVTFMFQSVANVSGLPVIYDPESSIAHPHSLGLGRVGRCT